MAHEGETVRGQAAILAKLQGVGQMNSTFGRVVYEVDHIDAQALGTVRARGTKPLPSPTPPGAPKTPSACSGTAPQHRGVSAGQELGLVVYSS